MSMPKMPEMDENMNREYAINLIISSIAMEELALSHILNAEGEKLQYVLGTLEGQDPGEVTMCDIMEVNRSIQKTIRDITKTEMLLQFKLEDALELEGNGSSGSCGRTISGKKIWVDSDDERGQRPPSVTINLLRDGDPYKAVTLDSMGDGNYSFKCLPIWKDPETQFVYSIDELDVPAGYAKTIQGFNITNTIQI